MTHQKELQLRLSDLNLKLAQEQALPNPVQLYIDDLKLTIVWVERQLKTAIAAV